MYNAKNAVLLEEFEVL